MRWKGVPRRTVRLPPTHNYSSSGPVGASSGRGAPPRSLAEAIGPSAADRVSSRILPLQSRPSTGDAPYFRRRTPWPTPSAVRSLLLAIACVGLLAIRGAGGCAGPDGQARADPRRLRAGRHSRSHRARGRRQAERHDRPAGHRREPARCRRADRGRRSQSRGPGRLDDHGDADRPDGGGSAHAEDDSLRSGEGLHGDRPRCDVSVRACGGARAAARRRGTSSSPGRRPIRPRRRMRRRRPAACRISSACCCRATSASTWCTSPTRAPPRTSTI